MGWLVRLVPEVYYVPKHLVAAEKAEPHSQTRLPNANVPLIWAQSLYQLTLLLRDKLITPAHIDPLGRRLRLDRLQLARIHSKTIVQVWCTNQPTNQ
jgi:hypothetical protein